MTSRPVLATSCSDNGSKPWNDTSERMNASSELGRYGSVFTRMKERFSRMRRLLIVEDDAVQREAVKQLLASQDVEIVAVETVAEALSQLGAGSFDCVVTDLSLPDASGYDLLERMAGLGE